MDRSKDSCTVREIAARKPPDAVAPLAVSSSQAHLKMPCVIGSTNGTIENISDVRRTLSRRTLDQNNFKFCPKERQVSALVLRDSEQRCIVFTLVALGIDTQLKFLAPILLPVQGSESRTYSDLKGLGSVSSPPAIIFQFDVTKEQNTNFSDNNVAPNSSPSQSSESNLLKVSRRSKRSKSIKIYGNSPAVSFASQNSSVSVCDDLNASNSSFLTPDIPKVDKTTKKSSKRKNKKKGKCKRPQKKFPTAMENQCEEGMADLPANDSSISSVLSCSADHDTQMDVSEPINSSSQMIGVKESASNIPIVDEVSPCSSDESCALQSQEVNELFSDDRTAYNHLQDDCSSCFLASRDSVDQYSNLVQESLLDCWNSDYSEICSSDMENPVSIKEKGGFSHSGSRIGSCVSKTQFTKKCINSSDSCNEASINSCLSTPSRLNEVVEDIDCDQRDESIDQADNNDFHPVVYKKRGRLARKLTGSSNSGNISAGANISGNKYGSASGASWNYKDSCYSMWKKVQKNDNNPALNIVRLPDRPFSQSPKGSDARGRLGTSMCTRGSNFENSRRWHRPVELMQMDSLASRSDDVGSNGNIYICRSGKPVDDIRGKLSSVSKQANNNSKKGSQFDQMNINKPTNVQIQKNDAPGSSQLLNDNKNTDLTSYSIVPGKSVAMPACLPGFCPAKDGHKSEKHMNGSRSLEINLVHDTLSQGQGTSLSSLNTLVQTPSNDHFNTTSNSTNDNMPVDVCDPLSNINDESCKSEIENTLTEHSSPGNPLGYVMQKWVPVGRKDPSVGFNSNQKVTGTANLQNAAVSVVSADSYGSCFIGGVSACSSPTSKATDCVSPEDDEFSIKSKTPSHSKEPYDVLSVYDSGSNLEVNDRCTLGVGENLDIIVRAVIDAYKYQTESESVRLVTGSPIAEFERLLHSASPILGQTGCMKSCESCFQDLILGRALYQHQVPNFSLHSIWHWYEKPGCYGLQVKGEDDNGSKGSRLGHSRYDAYFVPYLSAVQLFGRGNSTFDDENSHGKLAEKVDGKSNQNISARLGTLPIFAKLLPQPRKEVEDLCGSASAANQILSAGRCLEDERLLFEYFESDQPQQRRPLYEKIKELVRGDSSSASRMFGDPLNLESLKLHDFHPASWYSVAWYPIYRIPDGNFRAAFLTYHSLGHFVYQKTASSSSSGTACVVAPVVGLQSYNAKGECWFQPRIFQSQVLETEHTRNPNLSQILKERLRTLEQAASTMARASIWKEDQMSVNRQPDYEFFLSRNR